MKPLFGSKPVTNTPIIAADNASPRRTVPTKDEKRSTEKQSEILCRELNAASPTENRAAKLTQLIALLPALDDGHSGRGSTTRRFSRSAANLLAKAASGFTSGQSDLLLRKHEDTPAIPNSHSNPLARQRHTFVTTEHKRAFDTVMKDLQPKYDHKGQHYLMFGSMSLLVKDRSNDDNRRAGAEEIARRTGKAPAWNDLAQVVGSLKPARQEYTVRMFESNFNDVRTENRQAMFTGFSAALNSLCLALPAMGRSVDELSPAQSQMMDLIRNNAADMTPQLRAELSATLETPLQQDPALAQSYLGRQMQALASSVRNSGAD